MVLPSKVMLEASSHCQLKCPVCPTADGSTLPTIAKGLLRPDQFRRFLDQNPWVKRVELANYGEVFLNPWLPEILRLAHERKVDMSAVNGVNLNNVRAEALEAIVQYRLRAMTCSIDGASAETYIRYRKGGDFSRVIANIEAINVHKERLRSAYPVLTWQFVVFGHNAHEIAAARKLAKSLNMGFRLRLSWDDDYSPLSAEGADVTKREIGAASRAEFKALNQRDYCEGMCHQLWDAPQLNWDGTLLGCNRNFWGEFGPNIFEKGLKASLESEKMRYARAMLRGKVPARDDVPCTTCELYHNMAKREAWVKRGLGSRASMREALSLIDRLVGTALRNRLDDFRARMRKH